MKITINQAKVALTYISINPAKLFNNSCLFFQTLFLLTVSMFCNHGPHTGTPLQEVCCNWFNTSRLERLDSNHKPLPIFCWLRINELVVNTWKLVSLLNITIFCLLTLVCQSLVQKHFAFKLVGSRFLVSAALVAVSVLHTNWHVRCGYMEVFSLKNTLLYNRIMCNMHFSQVRFQSSII